MRDRRAIIWIAVLLIAAALDTTHAREQAPAFDSISARIDRFWAQIFATRGWTYDAPGGITHHNGDQRIVCGPTLADPATGPFYCVATRTIHIDLRFLQPATDAYGPTTILTATAHEWGHHIQILRGITAATHTRRERELQADCYAGAFVAADIRQGALAKSEVQQARRFLRSIGARHPGADADDSAHGTPAQRVVAFDRGFNGGVDACELPPRTTHTASAANGAIEPASPLRARQSGSRHPRFEAR